ncbi:hypothetical protein [Enterobacter hormaechei]|nr:hypothetical protein [Enterobacter hormaechei]
MNLLFLCTSLIGKRKSSKLIIKSLKVSLNGFTLLLVIANELKYFFLAELAAE